MTKHVKVDDLVYVPETGSTWAGVSTWRVCISYATGTIATIFIGVELIGDKAPPEARCFIRAGTNTHLQPNEYYVSKKEALEAAYAKLAKLAKQSHNLAASLHAELLKPILKSLPKPPDSSSR